MMLLTGVSAEDLCTDSDNGPDGGSPSDDVLTTVGSTKYGITTLNDVCVIGPSADVQTKESMYLKEYYCDNDKREFEIFDCSRFGFEKCVEGKCTGSSSGSSSGSNQNNNVIISNCGNKILEENEGEECDPPGSVCLDGDDYGVCLNDCKCRWHSQSSGAQQVTTIDTNNNQDTNTDKIQQTQKTTQNTNQNQENQQKQEDLYPMPNVTIPNTDDLKDFDDTSGIKVTRGITDFFNKIWDWFTNLF